MDIIGAYNRAFSIDGGKWRIVDSFAAHGPIPSLLGCHIQPADGRKGVINLLFLPHERGQGLVEYALILVLVAMIVIVILALLGPEIGNVFSNIINSI